MVAFMALPSVQGDVFCGGLGVFDLGNKAGIHARDEMVANESVEPYDAVVSENFFAPLNARYVAVTDCISLLKVLRVGRHSAENSDYGLGGVHGVSPLARAWVAFIMIKGCLPM
jgi:hypothetical protein